MTYRILTTIALAIIIGCASVSNPMGGLKDETPPQLVISTPLDQSIEYNQQTVTLTFDEWIKADQLQKELLITPLTEASYEYSQRKNQLTLTFKSQLTDSTTYTLNFRNAIKDITESNIWQNSSIAFSTGTFLDSMQINGTIQSLLTNEPSAEYLVGLYPSTIDTANLRQGKPLYLTSTDQTGRYSITNVKSGQYLLYAFLDKNNNLINNSSSEAYAFHDKKINLIDSTVTIELKSYYRNEDTLKIKNSGPSGKDFKISISKPLFDYNILATEQPTKLIYSALNEVREEITIYKENFPSLSTDSIQTVITITDSIGQIIKDTFYISFRESKIQNETLKVISKPLTDIISGQQQFQLLLNKPVQRVNYDSIYIGLNDSIILFPITEQQLSFNEHKNILTISTDLDKMVVDTLIAFHEKSIAESHPDTLQTIQDSLQSIQATKNSTLSVRLQPYLIIKKGTFTGIESDTLTSLKYSLQFMDIEDYGTIAGNVSDSTTNYIVQLVTDKYILTDSQQTKASYKFNYVKPGKYRIRVIRDSNNNKKWDSGNPLTLQPSEEILHYNELITVKANWEILDINIQTTIDLQSVDNKSDKYK
jgi:hypothetical protein